MNLKLPQESVTYLLLCLTGVLVFIIFAIIPAHSTLASLDVKLKNTQLQFEEQKTLAPFFRTLQQRTRKGGERALPFPQREIMPPEKMGSLHDVIKEIARQSNVAVISLSPVVGLMGRNNRSAAMEATLRGGFFSFRRFLIGLEGLAYVEHVEEFQMQQHPEGMELKIKFWVARG